MESAKLKKFVTAILWFLFLIVANWYLIGSRHALEYKEYIEIVESIEDAKLDSECVIDLKVETESPWGWTPASLWQQLQANFLSLIELNKHQAHIITTLIGQLIQVKVLWRHI
jgi:hypothetical protein